MLAAWWFCLSCTSKKKKKKKKVVTSTLAERHGREDRGRPTKRPEMEGVSLYTDFVAFSLSPCSTWTWKASWYDVCIPIIGIHRGEVVELGS